MSDNERIKKEGATSSGIYIAPIGATIEKQRVVLGKNFTGEEVEYTLNRWSTGILSFDATDGRNGVVPTEDTLKQFLEKHNLDDELNTIEDTSNTH